MVGKKVLLEKGTSTARAKENCEVVTKMKSLPGEKARKFPSQKSHNSSAEFQYGGENHYEKGNRLPDLGAVIPIGL